MKDKIQHDDASLLAGQPSSPLQPALCVTPLDHLPDPRSPGTRGTRRHERPQWGGRDPAIGIPPARRRLGPAVVPVVPDRGWYLVDRPGCTLAPRQADPLRTRRHAARVRLPVARVRRRGRDPHRGAARRAATAHGTRFQRPDTEPLDDVDAFTRRCIYEELLFRVVLVGLLAWAANKLLGVRPLVAGVVATVLGALIFSAFHYIGPYGDRLEVYSFVFRTIAGLFFSGLYLLRGFGITAWTHALYDVFLLLR